MQVVVKKKALEQLMRVIAEERSFHTRKYDQIAGDKRPVMPDAQVAAQISSDQVPVDDPDFLPVNKQQLSAAASQISKRVAPDKLQRFYSGLKKLIRKTSEPKQYKGMSETDLMEALRPLVLREVEDLEGEEDEDLSISDANERATEEILGWYNSLPRSKKTSFTMKPSGEKGWKTSDFELPAAKIPIEDPASIANAIMRQGEVQQILKREKGADRASVLQKISQFFSETAGPSTSVAPEELETLDATKIVDTFFRKADGDKTAFVQLIKDKRAELSAAGKKKKAGEIGLIAASYLRKFETPATPEKEAAEEPDEEAERAARAETLQKQLGDVLAPELELEPRSAYQKVGRYATGRPAILDPESASIEGEEGQITSDDLLDQKAEELAELFFDEVFSPIFQFAVRGSEEEEGKDKKSKRATLKNLEDYYRISSYDDFVIGLSSHGMMESWIKLVYDSCTSIAEKDATEFSEIPNIRLVFALADKNKGLLKVLEKKRPNIFKKLQAAEISQISRVRYLTEESSDQIRSVLEIVRRATIFNELLKIEKGAKERGMDSSRAIAAFLRDESLNDVIRTKIESFMDSMKEVFFQVAEPFSAESDKDALEAMSSLDPAKKEIAKKTIKFVNAYIDAEAADEEKASLKKKD